jgi:hypothetical protein
MRIVVTHCYYGCECGCCGHQVEVYENDCDDEHFTKFDFHHPEKGKEKEYAEELIREFLEQHHPGLVKNLNWDKVEINAVSSDDCYL